MSDWDSFEAFLADVRQVDDAKQRQDLVNALLRQRPNWPWIEGNRATFIHNNLQTQRAALNLDTIKDDPPFELMQQLEGTSLWYLTRGFEPDDLLDYMLAIDDPMTPLAQSKDLVARVNQHWHADVLNPLRITTPQIDVSVLRMPHARPFPDWEAMPAVRRGKVTEHALSSRHLNFSDRKLWVYTPPGYSTDEAEYPLLLLHDGLWCTGPLQVPFIADALIKHRRMRPAVIAMMQNPALDQRSAEYISNDRHALFMLTEVLPLIQQQYHIDLLQVSVGGIGLSAIAAMHAVLTTPPAYAGLLMISPPLQGQNRAETSLSNYRRRFELAEVLPDRIFQAVGRYENFSRFLKPSHWLADTLSRRGDVAFQYVEHGSGHGLVGFRGIMPEALAWLLPGGAEG